MGFSANCTMKKARRAPACWLHQRRLSCPAIKKLASPRVKKDTKSFKNRVNFQVRQNRLRSARLSIFFPNILFFSWIKKISPTPRVLEASAMCRAAPRVSRCGCSFSSGWATLGTSIARAFDNLYTYIENIYTRIFLLWIEVKRVSILLLTALKFLGWGVNGRGVKEKERTTRVYRVRVVYIERLYIQISIGIKYSKAVYEVQGRKAECA